MAKVYANDVMCIIDEAEQNFLYGFLMDSDNAMSCVSKEEADKITCSSRKMLRERYGLPDNVIGFSRKEVSFNYDDEPEEVEPHTADAIVVLAFDVPASDIVYEIKHDDVGCYIEVQD